jgi:hypothetical protein
VQIIRHRFRSIGCLGTPFYCSAIQAQDHYENIKFLNLQKVWQEQDFFPGSLVDGIHLSNNGHKLVSTYLSEWLFPFANDGCASP